MLTEIKETLLFLNVKKQKKMIFQPSPLALIIKAELIA
jgi:hypothetical protein